VARMPCPSWPNCWPCVGSAAQAGAALGAVGRAEPVMGFGVAGDVDASVVEACAFGDLGGVLGAGVVGGPDHGGAQGVAVGELGGDGVQAGLPAGQLGGGLLSGGLDDGGQPVPNLGGGRLPGLVAVDRWQGGPAVLVDGTGDQVEGLAVFVVGGGACGVHDLADLGQGVCTRV
jgi:hypothetical protein